MHHFLYPAKDAYISNKSLEKDKNFGIDEMLIIGVSHSYSNVLNTTKTYQFENEYVAGMSFANFTGKFTGSFFGTVYNSFGTIIGGNNKFTSSYFSGSISGSIMGIETGSNTTSSNFSGSVQGFSGNINSYAVNGNVSGSITTGCFNRFTGIFTSSIGSAIGYVTGDEIKSEINYTVIDKHYIDRALVKFDLDFISQSVVLGDIISPKFFLKLKSTEARELPISYKLYAFPISQSWDHGDGYFSDGGSDIGVSWNWRDQYSGSSWFSPTTDTIITSSVDYLNNYAYVSESFKRGGGTWYNIPCTQSFDYETSDINMDVTPIINAWFSKTIPNQGIILMYSGETNISSSNAHMFYFSKETNTIFSPRLDVVWDDSKWITGSFETGSVTINTYYPVLSGSMAPGITISGVIASGIISGNSYLVITPENKITSGSIVDITGLSDTINGLSINGTILGTSSIDIAGTKYITASLDSGDFTGCQIYGKYSGSMLTGFLSGSFNENLLVNRKISGSISTTHTVINSIYQYSPVSGNLIGTVVSGTFDGGVFQGVSTSGLLKGASVLIPFTGSYSYITSSLSITSSVQITASAFDILNTFKPFVVIIQGLKSTYSFTDVPRIGVFGREEFPLKNFTKSPQQVSYIIPKSLPSSSYYAIKDQETDEIIINFDNYTKISCDLNGNYFSIDTTGLEQERYYKILIRVDCLDGKQYTFDCNNIFKVSR